jgi:hypothetical protein
MIIEKSIKTLAKDVPTAFDKQIDILPPVWRKLTHVESIPIDVNKKPVFDADHLPELPQARLPEFRGEFPLGLMEEIDSELWSEIQQLGTDALAFYKPFHFYDDWGIYIRLRGVFYLANLLRVASKKSLDAIFKISTKILHSHESFHFLTEWASTFLELKFLKPFYKNYAKLSLIQIRKLEEALANAHSYRKLAFSERNKIVQFFSLQPTGYRDFRNYVNNDAFLFGRRELGSLIEGFSTSQIEEMPQFELLFNADSLLVTNEVPVYLVVETHRSSQFKFTTPIYLGGRIAAYPGDHPPLHIHVRIPADSPIVRKYKYPSLEPLDGYPPLTSKERKVVEEIIQKYKDKIERALSQVR